MPVALAAPRFRARAGSAHWGWSDEWAWIPGHWCLAGRHGFLRRCSHMRCHRMRSHSERVDEPNGQASHRCGWDDKAP